MSKNLIFLFLSLVFTIESLVAQIATPEMTPTLGSIIEKWLKQNPSKIKEALNDLPQEYRKNFTLMHSSQSAQESSAEFPRAILFGDTGETIFTFNGEESQLGYANLEIADFDSKTKKLNLYEVKFKKEMNIKNASDDLLPLSADEIFAETENLRISKANPEKCMACHSATFESKDGSAKFNYASYIWGSYNKWPGAYGAADDQLYPGFTTDPRSERSDFLEFKNKSIADKNSRYNFLEFGSEHPESPYQARTRQLRFMPNTVLGLLIAANYSRMVSSFILKDAAANNKNSELNKWLCHQRPELYSYAEKINFFGKESDLQYGHWVVGAYNTLGYGLNLPEHVRGQVAKELWNYQLTAKDKIIYSFYDGFTPKRIEFLLEKAFVYLNGDEYKVPIENMVRLKEQHCN